MAQNFKNHTRFSVPFHFMTMPLILITLSLAIYAFTENPDLIHALLMSAFVLIGIIAFFTRTFALKVQDRAIRTDERLRYFMLTGKRLPDQLRLGQIIALRFASDDELPELVEKAIIEKLSSKEIKKAIVHWRADYHRV